MISRSLCLRCRGTKHLCGLTYCPILVRSRVSERLMTVSRRISIEGNSPPTVFLGWRGYPYIQVGPSLPPAKGDTEIFDYPEKWSELSLEELLAMRLSLVRGVTRLKVTDTESRVAMLLQEIALSEKPVGVELVLKKLIRGSVELSEEVPPVGPGAPLRRVILEDNPSFGRHVERVYYDRDLKADEAVVKLYRENIPVSRIQKIFSVGGLGKRRRRFVPTRWSITAVDDIISKSLIKQIKYLPELGSIEIFTLRKYNNLFVAILIPGQWSFEWMEAWFPGSTWNPKGPEVSIEADWEGVAGRTKYPDIGGCYYASRLPTAEYLLHKAKRKANAVLYREIYEGFNLPIGVWFVRESIREMFSQRPIRVSSLEEVEKILSKVTRIPVEIWWRRSHILSRLKGMRSLYDYAR